MRPYSLLLMLPFLFVLGAGAQESNRLPLHAALVLPQDLCKLEIKQGSNWTWKDKFEIGKAFCPAAEQLAKETFSRVTIRKDMPPAGQLDADVLLVPKILAGNATNTATVFGTRHMIVQVEWTATESAGKPVWVQTIEGSADQKSGGGFSFNRGKNAKKMMEATIASVTELSKAAMLESKEFRSLTPSARP